MVSVGAGTALESFRFLMRNASSLVAIQEVAQAQDQELAFESAVVLQGRLRTQHGLLMLFRVIPRYISSRP